MFYWENLPQSSSAWDITFHTVPHLALILFDDESSSWNGSSSTFDVITSDSSSPSNWLTSSSELDYSSSSTMYSSSLISPPEPESESFNNSANVSSSSKYRRDIRILGKLNAYWSKKCMLTWYCDELSASFRTRRLQVYFLNTDEDRRLASQN